MSLSRTLTRGRRMAIRAMTATCVVRRKVGEDVDNFKKIPRYETIYEGICKPQSFRPQEGLAGHLSHNTRTVTRSEVHFPIGEFVAKVGDIVTITGSEHNPLLVGLHFRVVDDDLVTEHPTAYHVPVTRDADTDVPPLSVEEEEVAP